MLKIGNTSLSSEQPEFVDKSIKEIDGFSSSNKTTTIIWTRPYTFTLEQPSDESGNKLRFFKNVTLNITFPCNFSDGSSKNKTIDMSQIDKSDSIYIPYKSNIKITPISIPGIKYAGLDSIDMDSQDSTYTLPYSVIPYSLKVLKDSGIESVSINRDSSIYAPTKTGAITEADPIYYGDQISFSWVLKAGHQIEAYVSKIYGVTGDEIVNFTSSWIPYTLTLSPDTHSSITAIYKSSPYHEEAARKLGMSWIAPTDPLKSGATIYWGDEINFSYSTDNYYSISTHTVTDVLNTTDFNNTNIKLYGDSTAKTTSSLTPYKLTLSIDSGVSSAQILRNGIVIDSIPSTLGSSNPATIYYGDILTVVASANSNSKLNDFVSTYNVVGDLNINITSKLVLRLVVDSCLGIPTVNRTKGSTTGNLNYFESIESNDSNGYTIETTYKYLVNAGDVLTISGTSKDGSIICQNSYSYTIISTSDNIKYLRGYLDQVDGEASSASASVWNIYLRFALIGNHTTNIVNATCTNNISFNGTNTTNTWNENYESGGNSGLKLIGSMGYNDTLFADVLTRIEGEVDNGGEKTITFVYYAHQSITVSLSISGSSADVVLSITM